MDHSGRSQRFIEHVLIDYKDLFNSLEKAVADYTTEAFGGYDSSDVKGLLENRLDKAKEDLEDALEKVRALCEPVDPPRDTAAFMHYFCAKESGNADQLKANEPKRLELYKSVASLLRAYAAIANEMGAAGYTKDEAEKIRKEVQDFENVRNEVKQGSGDYIDLKSYEPAMRHLIDAYIQAEDSKLISTLDDMTLIQLIVERGEGAVNSFPQGISNNKEAVAEAIENNVRRLIIDERPLNPKYYDKMSELLDALIKKRKEEAIAYEEYLKEIIELTKQIQTPSCYADYPPSLSTMGKRSLYDNLDKNEALALQVDEAVLLSKEHGWIGNPIKEKKVRIALTKVLSEESMSNAILEIVKLQEDYQ